MNEENNSTIAPSTCPRCGKENVKYTGIKATKVYDIVDGKKVYQEYTKAAKWYECGCGCSWRG